MLRFYAQKCKTLSNIGHKKKTRMVVLQLRVKSEIQLTELPAEYVMAAAAAELHRF